GRAGRRGQADSRGTSPRLPVLSAAASGCAAANGADGSGCTSSGSPSGGEGRADGQGADREAGRDGIEGRADSSVQDQEKTLGPALLTWVWAGYGRARLRDV